MHKTDILRQFDACSEFPKKVPGGSRSSWDAKWDVVATAFLPIRTLYVKCFLRAKNLVAEPIIQRVIAESQRFFLDFQLPSQFFWSILLDEEVAILGFEPEN